jgi:hypothetical protein
MPAAIGACRRSVIIAIDYNDNMSNSPTLWNTLTEARKSIIILAAIGFGGSLLSFVLSAAIPEPRRPFEQPPPEKEMLIVGGSVGVIASVVFLCAGLYLTKPADATGHSKTKSPSTPPPANEGNSSQSQNMTYPDDR